MRCFESRTRALREEPRHLKVKIVCHREELRHSNGTSQSDRRLIAFANVVARNRPRRASFANSDDTSSKAEAAMRWRCLNATDFPCAPIKLKRKTHGEALRLNQEGTGEPQPYGRRIGGGRS